MTALGTRAYTGSHLLVQLSSPCLLSCTKPPQQNFLGSRGVQRTLDYCRAMLTDLHRVFFRVGQLQRVTHLLLYGTQAPEYGAVWLQ